jgi:lipoprotein-anchoring transpeptidase ErfK/SrfK
MEVIWRRLSKVLLFLLIFPLNSYSEKVIIVNPNNHSFKAYYANGQLARSGIVTAGNSWCRDIKRACKTKAGTFRIYSLGGPECKSRKYPLPRGGAPMPYCMFFNGGQGLHGSYEVVRANVSHGCVRLQVPDARWLRYNFVEPGTKVIVRPY